MKLLWEKSETVIFLALLGALTIMLVYGMDQLSLILEGLLNELILDTSVQWWALDVTAYMMLTASMMLVVVLLVRFVAPRAAGSGIPALIASFTGVSPRNLTGFRTLFTKVVGLVLV